LFTMAERNPFNRRPPEDVLVPEYWDGHGFKDDCGWEKPQKPTKGGKQPGLFETVRGEASIHKFAKEKLMNFMALTDKMNIAMHVRTFADGETFDVHNFPLGTIIRFEKETMRCSERDQEPSYAKGVYLGVISESPTPMEENGETRVLATYLRPFVTAKRVLRFQIRLAPNVIQIGVVNHERRNNDEGYTFWDEMIRFKSLDVLRIGQGMPEKDGKEQSIPQLNPVTQEN